MAKKREFIVLGLGSFGEAIARRLVENGCYVIGVDQDEQRINDLKDILYAAVTGDATESAVLEQLPLKNAEAVIISLGDNMAPSLLATLHAKELQAKRLIVKSVSADHAKILMRLGVDRVVFPETEFAKELADRLTWPNFLDYIPIGEQHAFGEVAMPDSFVGKTLQELELRQKFGVWVVGVKEALTGKLTLFPDGRFQLDADQLLLVVGNREDVEKFRESIGKSDD